MNNNGRFNDPINNWIKQIVPNKSFVDIGGIGVDSCNERATGATQAGAAKVAMADIRPFDYYEWEVFSKIWEELGEGQLERYEKIDITDPNFSTSLPVFDVVHSTGILYHLPDPVSALNNLVKISGEYLITNTVTIPEKIKNSKGTLEFKGNSALFLPGISQQERSVLKEYYDNKFDWWKFDEVAPKLEEQSVSNMPYMEGGKFSCWPYWWLLTDNTFRSILKLTGLEIVDQWKWEDHALACLCKVNKR